MKKINLKIILILAICLYFASSCKKETKETETPTVDTKLPTITFENDSTEFTLSKNQVLNKKIIFYSGYKYKTITIYRKKNNNENILYELIRLDTNTKHNYLFTYKIKNEDYKDNSSNPNNKITFRIELINEKNHKIEKTFCIYLKHNNIKSISNVRLGASNHILGSFFGVNTFTVYNMLNVNQNANNIDFVFDYVNTYTFFSPETYTTVPLLPKKSTFFKITSMNDAIFEAINNNDSIILAHYYKNYIFVETSKIQLVPSNPFYAIKTFENKIGIIKIESFENDNPNELGNSIKFSLKVQE